MTYLCAAVGQSGIALRSAQERLMGAEANRCLQAFLLQAWHSQALRAVIRMVSCRSRADRAVSWQRQLALSSRQFFAWMVVAFAVGVAVAATGDELVTRANELRSSVQAATTLTEDQKTQAVARLDEAIGFTRDTAAAVQAKARLRATIDAAPARLQLLKDQIAQLSSQRVDEAYESQSTEQLDANLLAKRANLATLQEVLAGHVERLNALQVQGRSDAAELATLEARLSELGAEPGGSRADDLLAAAEELWRSARRMLLRERADVIVVRQGNINLLTELARNERDVAAAEVDIAKQQLSSALDARQARRQQEAEAAVSAAKGLSGKTPDGLQAVQMELAGLVREQAQLIVQEAALERQLGQVNRTLERLKRDYERIQQVVELGGSSTQVSMLLQKRRQLAPSAESLGREVLKLQQPLSDAGLRQLELDELLQQLVDDKAALSYLQETKGINTAAIAAAGQSEALREVAVLFRQTALDLWQSYTRFMAVVSQLEANTRTLSLEARRYRTFIDDRLLWVPSTELIPLDQPALLLDGVHWLVSVGNLKVLLADLAQLPSARTAASVLWLLGIIVLTLLRQRALQGLKRCQEVTQKVRTDRFSVTLMALFYTLILIAWVPWILIGAGLLLGTLAEASNTTLIYAAGLQAAGQVILFLGSFRHLCRAHGLALVHLYWHPSLCEHLARQATWLIPLMAPLGFVTAAAAVAIPSDFVYLAKAVQDTDPGVVALGRLAFAAQMLLLAIAIHRIWRRHGRVMSAFAESPDHVKWDSYHVLWFGPAILVPVLLGGSALLGYFYSATFLASVAGVTLWFVVAAVLGKDLLLRGLYVTQRRLRFEEALRHRDEIQEQRAGDGEAVEVPADSVLKGIEEEKVSYSQLGDQVRSLVQLGFALSIFAGLWWIWRDIFPAFTFLHNVELPITTSKLVDGVTKDVPLTLSDMVAGLLLGGLALFAAAKVPALLELTLLQRLPMSRASRYAVTTLSQYVVAMIGVVITFSSLGLQWSSIQWLVAALSVGLGFGLQEIVANFISGIILLFEQPIRVGDVVTVDGTTGTVSKIRIRATTIVNWERQELVIPNKTFITGQLINWTLTDTVNRVFVSVGVSYATDTRLAMELMRQVAEEHPNVVSDPPFRISFEGFGDNALTLNIRAFLGNMESRLQTITELHQNILERFREAGIEIAFPQRDVHLSTTEPLELQLRRDRRGRDPDSA